MLPSRNRRLGAGSGFGRRLGLGSGRGLRLLLGRFGDRRLRHLAEVELGVRVLAGARLERRLALARDVEAAGIWRLHLVGAGFGLDQLRRAVHRRVAAAEPEKGGGDQQRGSSTTAKRGKHLARGDAARLVLVLDRLQPGQLPVVISGAVVAHRSTLRLPRQTDDGAAIADRAPCAGTALRNGPARWCRSGRR